MRGPLSSVKVLGPLGLAVILLATAAPTSAQDPIEQNYDITIDARYDPSPIRPIQEVRTIQLEVTIRCASLGIEPGLAPKQVRYSIQPDHPWVVATLSKGVDHFETEPQGCLQGHEEVFHVSADVTVTKDAPAFATSNVLFSAQLDDGPVTARSVLVQAGFYENWQARMEDSIIKGGPWEVVEVPLVIENHGNGALLVRFLVNEQSSKALTAVMPPPQIVSSVIAGGETSTLMVPIDVRLPDDGPRMDQLVLDVAGTSADDPTRQLDPVRLAAVFHTDGSVPESDDSSGSVEPLAEVDELPALGPVWVLAAAAALLARRRV